MSTVMALHPAPVAYVPKRSRNVRDGFVAMRTPVSVRSVPRDGFEPVAVPASMTGIPEAGLLRDGDGLWIPMTRLVGGTTEDFVGRDHLLWYLEGDKQKANLDYPFRRTPVAAPNPLRPGINAAIASSHRGHEHDLDGARTTVLDGRGRAAEGVALHMDRNVRMLTGAGLPDQAYLRFVPALAMVAPFRDGEALWRLLYDPNHHAARGLVCQPGDIDALREIAGEFGITDNDDRMGELAEALGPGDWERDIQERIANVYAGEVANCISSALIGSRLVEGLNERLLSLCDRMRTMAAFAEIGLAQGDDARTALAIMAEAIAASGRTAVPRTGPFVLEAAINRFHMAAKASPALDADDLSSLETLAPSR